MEARNSTYFSLPLKSDISNDSSLYRKRKSMIALNPYERHKELVSHYRSLVPTPIKLIETDIQVLKKSHQFLREENEEDTYESRLARKYYEKLFKEYCLGDFSRFKTGAIGLRWRTKSECEAGKGHFICGNLVCLETNRLHSWEVNFAYLENGGKKNALVKIKLCIPCSNKLNYQKIKLERRAAKLEENYLESRERKRPRVERTEQQVDDVAIKEVIEPIVNEDEDDEMPNNLWAAPYKPEDLEPQKSKEDEMDDFLKSMFD